MTRIFLSIGSNIEPEKNVPACLKILKDKFSVSHISNVYETDPVGPAGHLKFWNLAVSIETELEGERLISGLRAIENQLGRKRAPNNKFLARTIDLDILPQADYQRQAFIIVPLAEIAPEAVDPETGKCFEDLAKPLRGEASKFRKINLPEADS